MQGRAMPGMLGKNLQVQILGFGNLAAPLAG
jgi:hypothetical protein